MATTGALSLMNRLAQSVLMSKLKSGTNYLFHRHLLATNMGISISLSCAGDILQQNYEKFKSDERKFDKRRTFNMGTTGLTIGFFCHHWYNWLDKFMPGRTIKIVLKKVLVDQIICSPATISIFFVTLALVEKNSAQEFLDELRAKSWRLYLAEWVVWPPAQVFNFYCLPTRYRVLYDNTISLGYDTYTSYVKNELPTTPSSSSSSTFTASCQPNTLNIKDVQSEIQKL